MMTVVVMGLAWYTVGALRDAPRSIAAREIETGKALQSAKDALLAYVARQAARADVAVPGQLPCPEPLAPGAGAEGIAAGCTNNTATFIGRLPWRTLGVDQIRDADGELLWYILGSGFRDAPVNFDTLGAIELDGVNNAVVALIIAPGPPLNTLHLSPAGGCSTVNQQGNRAAKPYDPALFLECGRSSVPAPGVEAQYSSPVVSTVDPLTNDRIMRITAADVMNAIAGPVADRLQREIAPVLAEWRSTESVSNWGASFLPYSSTFSDPAINDLCGNFGVHEGLPTVARSVGTTCTSWTGGTVTQLAGLLGFPSCTQHAATNTYRCTFFNLSLFVPLTARITATAPNVAGSFRAPITAADITNNQGGTVTSFSLSLSSATGDADLSADIAFPLLSFGAQITVIIANLPDGAVLADPRMAWYLNNDWGRHTYYTIAQGARLGAASPCSAAGDPDCLTLNGLPAGNGSTSDKQVILALMGPALSGQARPSGAIADYIESRVSATSFDMATVSSTFNDRLATCPFHYTPHSGGTVSVCN